MIVNPYNEREVLAISGIASPASLTSNGFVEVSGGYVMQVSHPFGGEYNWPRFTITWDGTGRVSARTVGSDTVITDLASLSSKSFYSLVSTVVSGKEYHQSIRVNKKTLSHIYLLLIFTGDVTNISIDYRLGDFHAISNGESLAGHVLRTISFDGLQVPYRVMLPKNYDPSVNYPVVVSLSGTGGLGQTPYYQAINMTEWLTLGYAQYSKYYHHDGVVSTANPSGKNYQCISVLVSGYNDFTGSQYVKDNCIWEGLNYVRNNNTVCPSANIYGVQNLEDELEYKLLDRAKRDYVKYYLPESIKRILDVVISEYSVDAEKVIYYGFSFGALLYENVSYLADYFSVACLIDTGPTLSKPGSSGNIGLWQYPSEVSAYVHQAYMKTKRWCEQVETLKIMRRTTAYFASITDTYPYSDLTEESDRILEGSSSLDIIDSMLEASESESVYTSNSSGIIEELHSLHVSQPSKFFTDSNMDAIFSETKQEVVNYPYPRNIGLVPQPEEFWAEGELDYYSTVLTEMIAAQPAITKSINKKPISKGIYPNEHY